jgi:hypothetical protein
LDFTGKPWPVLQKKLLFLFCNAAWPPKSYFRPNGNTERLTIAKNLLYKIGESCGQFFDLIYYFCAVKRLAAELFGWKVNIEEKPWLKLPSVASSNN